MTILKVDDGVLLYGLRINVAAKWAAIFFGKQGLVIMGRGEGR